MADKTGYVITYPGKEVALSKEFIYRHCVARGDSLKSLDDGTLILIQTVCAYDTDDGSKIISIIGNKWNAEQNGFENALSHLVSNSSIFRTDFEKIVEIFGDTGITIRIRKNVSKAGRTFVTCELA